MFSGSRCCLRANAKRALPNPAPVQSSQLPLTFLYPPWFSVNDQPSAHHPARATKTQIRRSSWLKGHEDFLYGKSSDTKSAPRSHVDLRTGRPSKASANSIAEVTRKTTGQRVKISQDVDNLDQSLGSGPRAEPPTKSKSETETTQESRSSLRLMRYNLALKMLLDVAPTSKSARGDIMWLSTQALELACGTSQENSWIHHVQDGCSVQVMNTPASDFRKLVLLRGSPLARELTRSHLLSFEAASSPSVVRLLQSREKNHLTDYELLRAGQLPRKAVHSLSSFLHLIELWTAPNVPRLAKRDFSKASGKDYDEVVARELVRFSTSPSTAKFASAAALDHILYFLSQHPNLTNHVMPIYRHHQKSQMALSRRTYSSMLLLLLRVGKMPSFHQVLSDMAEEGCGPDFRVWQTILRAEPSLEKKYALTGLMTQKGLLQEKSIKGVVVAEIAVAELVATRSAKLPTGEQFISSMDARFGADWMSESTLRLIWRFCERWREYSLAFDLLAEAQKRGVHLSSSTTTSFLRLLLRRGSIEDSISLLRSHLVRTTGRDDAAVIPVLFLAAWRRRSYNVCRLLWSYAAVRGLTSKVMQERVTNSLRQFPTLNLSQACTGTSSNAGDGWTRQAGVVIIGVGTDFNALSQSIRLIDLPPTSSEAETEVNAESNQDDLNFAQKIVQSDLEAWKRFAIPSSARFLDLLHQAYDKDLEWKQNGIGLARGGQSVAWMIENSIEVKLVKREPSLRSKSVAGRLGGDPAESEAPLTLPMGKSFAIKKVKQRLVIRKIAKKLVIEKVLSRSQEAH